MATNEVYPDPSLHRVLDYACGDADSLLDTWLQRVHPDDSLRVQQEVQAHVDGETEMYEAEYRMLSKDGNVRWLLVRGSAVRNRDGRAVRLVGTHTDITERKRAEAKLSDAQTELARVSRLSALGEFAASIAHELNQPLTAIMLNAEACQRSLGTASPPIGEIRAALSDLLDTARRANEIIRRNRALFRHHTVEKLPLEVHDIVREVASLARMRLESSQVKLETTLQRDLPAVSADRVQLQQVLLNLLINGIEAMETVDPRLRRLEIDAHLAAEGTVQISVRDSGIGLGGVDLERMFLPSYTTKPTGTGVGLSISRSIVEAHGGRLWAASADGAGAVFCFTLPIAAGEPAAIVAPHDQHAGADRARGTAKVI